MTQQYKIKLNKVENSSLNSRNIEKDSKSQSFQYQAIISYRQTDVKYVFVILATICNAGGFYNQTWTANLRNELVNDISIGNNEIMSEDQYQFLNSFAAVPGIIVCLFISLIMSKIGVRMCVILFSLLQLIGQSLSFIGAINSGYYFIIFGKAIQSVGVECLTTTTVTILTKWAFDGGQLAIYTGLQVGMARIFSVISSWVCAPLYYLDNKDTLVFPLFVGLLVQLFALICGIMAFTLDKKCDQQENQINQQLLNNNEGESSNQQSNKQQANFSFRHLKYMKQQFWINNIIQSLGWSVYFTIIANLNPIFNDKFGINPVNQGRLLSIPSFIAMGTPLLALIVLKYGQRPLFYIISAVCSVSSMILLLELHTCKGCTTIVLIPMIIEGFFLAFFTTVCWAIIPFTVPQQITGFAVGLTVSCKNLCQMILPLIIAPVVKSKKGQRNELYLYLILSFVMLALTIYYYIIDIKSGGKLKSKIPQKDQTDIIKIDFEKKQSSQSLLSDYSE